MSTAQSSADRGGLVVKIPMKLKRHGSRRQIVIPNKTESQKTAKPDKRDPIVVAIARAHMWQAALDRGDFKSSADLAQHLGLSRPHVSRILQLARLAPDLIESILAGDAPDHLTLEDLKKPLPMEWGEQRVWLSPP